MSHRFTPGQSVVCLASIFEAAEGSGRYTIVQLLPAERGEYQYTVRRDKTGELRRAREAQLQPLPITTRGPTPLAKRHVRTGARRTTANAAH